MARGVSTLARHALPCAAGLCAPRLHYAPVMKQHPAPLARATALLLVGALFPLSPLSAQEAKAPAETAAQTPAPGADDSVSDESAADPAPAEVEATAATPGDAGRTPVATDPARRSTRTTTSGVPSEAPPTVVIVTPSAPPPTELTPLPLPEALPQGSMTPDVLPETPGGVDIATTVEPGDRGSMLPWLLGGLVMILASLVIFGLRRRRGTTLVHEGVREAHASPAVAEVVPVAAAAALGEPYIELRIHRIRAGIGESDARVDFELTVSNSGSGPAENLRVSTWMLASDATEMARMLIEPREHADTPPVVIGAGESRTVEASVALPTSHVRGDSLLPVVVADAHYRLPDGREGRTSASFQVGVAVEGELAHFDVRNPSGLHEDVEARLLR